MASLALRGVPLPAAPLVTEADIDSAPFAFSQAAFDEARGAGTPLLPVPASTADAGPAPYVRQVITDMLCRHAAGETPHPIGDFELAVASEAHLALVEAVASEAAAFNPVPPPAPSLPNTVTPIRFAAVESGDPSWLAATVLKSLVRSEGVLPPRSTAPVSTATSPLARLAEESAYWRNVAPHGARDKIVAEGRASAMASVKAAPRMYVDPEYPPAANDVNGWNDSRWIADQAARMGGAIAAGRSAGMLDPGQTGLKAAILAKMSSNEMTVETDRSAQVIDAGSVHGFLSTYDIMRDYGFQSV